MTRRGGGGASSKPEGTTKPPQPKPAPGNPPVPTLPRGQSFGPGKKPSGPPVELSFGPGKPGAVLGKTGGRKRRKHRKTHRKTRRGY